MADVLLTLDDDGFHLATHSDDVTHRAPEELWKAYRDGIEMVNTIEDQINLAHKIEEPLPDDLQALVGILSDAEIAKLVEFRRAKDAPVSENATDAPPAPAEDVEGAVDIITNAPPKTPIPPCPKGKGGRHTPARYALRENGTVAAQCICGRWFEGVKCPHRTQMRQGRNIICGWCHKTIIANTQSNVDVFAQAKEDPDALWQVDITAHDGNADG